MVLLNMNLPVLEIKDPIGGNYSHHHNGLGKKRCDITYYK